MNFASWPFLFLFLPTVIAVFVLIRGRRAAEWRQAWLIAASFFFYGVSGLGNLALLVGSLSFNFVAGRLLALDRPLPHPWRKAILWGAVSANVALLAGFKWHVVEAETFDGFLSSPTILIPLALSFITFQLIGFVVACYRRQVERPDFFTYLFFISFFPQLILGPIVSYGPIREQLRDGALSRASLENFAVGLSIFIVGLVKKVAIADPLARPVDILFTQAAHGSDLTSPEAWFAIIAFQFQLFFDFSGYADMAIGLGRMFGINLPINFDRPLHATDRFDLWRRWHITFVVFMRNNVFMPLIRHWKLSPAAALAVTGILSGLWHGLGLTFIVWGLLQTALMLGAHWRRQRRRRSDAWTGRGSTVWAIATTFLVTCLIGALFRSPSWTAAVEVYGSLAGLSGAAGPLPQFLRLGDYAQFALAAAAVWIWPDTPRLFARVWTALDPRPGAPGGRHLPPLDGRVRFTVSARWGIILALLLLWALLGIGQAGRFVYVQF